MDGAAPGRQRFEAVTGIKRHDWYGLYWARWGDALQEAGLTANTLQGQFDRDQVLKAYVGLIEKLGRIPSEGDIRIERRSNKAFPSHSTISNQIGLRGDRLIAALEHARENALGGRLQDLLAEAIARLPAEKESVSDAAEPLSPITTGFVYMMKSGKFYKIGKTNSIDRRQYEIGLQLAEGLTPIHSIETDDPSGIEAYWHNRFKDKRMNGEWFNLDASDVRAFRLRKKFM
jgi:Meiotically up-regulated gene 113